MLKFCILSVHSGYKANYRHENNSEAKGSGVIFFYSPSDRKFLLGLFFQFIKFDRNDARVLTYESSGKVCQ